MKTIFLLHGGTTDLHYSSNLSFWRIMAERPNVINRCLRVLSINFASPAHSSLLDRHCPVAMDLERTLNWANPHKDFLVVSATLEGVCSGESIKWADIIYVHGGDGDLLQETLYPIKDTLGKLVAGKVCAGNSAGANLWSKQYYSNDNDAVCQGFGILPVQTFCHYKSDKWGKLNKLIRSDPKGELRTIPLFETEYVILSSD